MRYLNHKTQAVIDTACVLSGGDWIEVKEQPKSTKSKSTTKTKKKSGD